MRLADLVDVEEGTQFFTEGNGPFFLLPYEGHEGERWATTLDKNNQIRVHEFDELDSVYIEE